MSSSDEIEPAKRPKSNDTDTTNIIPLGNSNCSSSQAATSHQGLLQARSERDHIKRDLNSSVNSIASHSFSHTLTAKVDRTGTASTGGVSYSHLLGQQTDTNSCNSRMAQLINSGNSTSLLNGGSSSGSVNGKIKVPSSANSSSDMSLYSYPEMRFAEEWVKLNVGGTYLTSTRTTLCKYSQENNHFLAALVNNHAEMNSFKDETGAFMIDRSPATFKYVIDFLRTGRLDLPNDKLLEGILAEAEFCNLQSLIKLCLSKIEKRDNDLDKLKVLMSGNNGHKKVVYRVIQSSNVELTQMISTLSESWRLEQIIALNETDSGASHNNSGTEYLVVVSQEQESSSSNGLSNSNYDNDKVKALSGSMSSQTIRNLYR